MQRMPKHFLRRIAICGKKDYNIDGMRQAAAFAVSEQWFWIPFLMFLVSLSGWAGKFVASAVVLGQPAGSYLQDNGGSIKVYTPAEV